jgi:Skp family chaperone for outer membrane proteins
MFKMIATFAAAVLLSAVTLATAADAGCGRHGFHNYAAMSSLKSSQRAAQLRAKKAKQERSIAAAKRKAQPQVAKAEKAPVAEAAPAVAEAAPATAEAAQEPVTVAATEAKCTKFVAAIGSTVEVECSKE